MTLFIDCVGRLTGVGGSECHIEQPQSPNGNHSLRRPAEVNRESIEMMIGI